MVSAPLEIWSNSRFNGPKLKCPDRVWSNSQFTGPQPRCSDFYIKKILLKFINKITLSLYKKYLHYLTYN